LAIPSYIAILPGMGYFHIFRLRAQTGVGYRAMVFAIFAIGCWALCLGPSHVYERHESYSAVLLDPDAFDRRASAIKTFNWLGTCGAPDSLHDSDAFAIGSSRCS